jgi:DNA-binding CsgD family transcriptional regulator/PAS domain-containing protein
MALSTPVNKLLGTLYAAPMQPELWNAFLAELSAVTGVTKAALISHNIATEDHPILAYFGESVRESASVYEDHYCQFDEWTSRFPKNGYSGRIIRGDDYWPRQSMLRSVFYNEFLRRFDTCEVAGITVVATPTVFEALSVYRGPSEHEFSDGQVAPLEIIAPHLRTALYTRRKLLSLESRVNDLETTLDQLTSALVMIDATGKTVFVNTSARQILDRNDGLCLKNGRLTAPSITENARLREIEVKAILTCNGKTAANPGAMLVSRNAGRPLQLVASPLRSVTGTMPGKAVAVIFITDPDLRPTAPDEVLRILFGLTRAESRLAMSLLDGNSLAEAANANRVGQETVRSQIKSIFQKTGTRRQGELVHLLAGVPIPSLNP